MACHRQGRTGGGGPVETNVDLLSVIPPKGKMSHRRKEAFRRRLTEIHPGFAGDGAIHSNLVLHRFGGDKLYDVFRLQILGLKIPAGADDVRRAKIIRAFQKRRLRRLPVEELSRKHKVSLLLTQRNSPALFGAALIDSISERTLNAIAKQQPKRHAGVTGRVARANNGGVGRFGGIDNQRSKRYSAEPGYGLRARRGMFC